MLQWPAKTGMFLTADQLVCHAIGDYILQSDWMATQKTKKTAAALSHALAYTTVFVFITRSIPALLVIMATHFAIDRWRLARFACFLKNHLSPPSAWPSWTQSRRTGYAEGHPEWLVGWLLIIVDNLLHVCINALAIWYL